MEFWHGAAADIVQRDDVRVYRDQPETVVALLEQAVRRRGDASAAAEVGGASLTYAELWERAGGVAAALQARHGVEPGDRVAFLAANSVDLLLGVIGTWRAGAVAATLNTRYTAAELATLLGLCAPKVVLAEAEFAAKVPASLPLESLQDAAGEPAPVTLYGGDPALLMYTSGTTGLSKGALQTHLNLVSAAETWRRCLELTEDDTTVVAAPMFHATGLNAQSLPLLAAGGFVSIQPRFDAAALAALLAHGAATFFHAAPTIYLLTLRAGRRARALRVAVSGGSFVGRELVAGVREFAPGVDFRISYGMTETSSPAVLTPPGWIDDRPGDAVGVPVPVDDVEVDEAGEIRFRGATVIRRYDRDAAADSFLDGWLRSGDLGTIDERGFVTVRDRLKDVINRGGEKVASLEVEDVLCAHPAVLEAAVVARPDETYGEVPRAIVVLAEGAEASGAELRAFAAERLARYKVPVDVEFAAELPRNPGGKVLKSLLR